VATILMTAASDARKLAEALGLPSFLGKPFGVDDLMVLLDRAWSERRCAPDAASRG
jgi:DNA-binding NtrC family response regulator